jgi:branched-chain amino acid transport system permease protein
MRTWIVTGAIAVLIAAGLILGGGMDNGPAPFITLGIMNGAVFGLVALGLVLVYKGTRVFNFTQGEFGTIAAYILFYSITKFDLPYWFGIVLALAITLLIGVGIERIFIRPLINAPRVNVLVVTIAIALLLIGLEILIFRVEPESLRSLIAPVDSAGNATGITVFDLPIEPQRLIALGVLAALGVGLAYFFSRTDLGLAVLATSQDAFATRVVGIGVERMSRFIWAMAALLGAVAGILYVPLTGSLTPAVMTANILIPAFTGAVLGGMTSLPGAFLGGVVIGVVQSTALWAGGHFTVGSGDTAVALSEKIPGVEQVSILIVLLVVLMIRPAGLLGKET